MPARSMIDPRVSGGELLHAGDLIGQRVVAHVAVIRLVECLRAPRCAHPVDLDDHEAEFGERLRVAARRRERARADAAGLRTRINVIDDRILLRRIEGRRLVEQAVEIGDAVARLDRDRLRRFPAARRASLEMSAFSSGRISLPLASRSSATGGVSGVEYTSTK